MKKIYSIILVIIITIGVIILILLQKKRDARPFNTYDFPETINIVNGTNYEKADTIVLVLANKIFNLNTLNLKIYYLSDLIVSEDMIYNAIIQQLHFGHNNYLLLLNKNLSLSQLKLTLSHEFVHINQYQSGDLKVYKHYAIFKGDSIFFRDVKYRDRSFEKDAFKNQTKILKELNNFLY